MDQGSWVCKNKTKENRHVGILIEVSLKPKITLGRGSSEVNLLIHENGDFFILFRPLNFFSAIHYSSQCTALLCPWLLYCYFIPLDAIINEILYLISFL